MLLSISPQSEDEMKEQRCGIIDDSGALSAFLAREKKSPSIYQLFSAGIVFLRTPVLNLKENIPKLLSASIVLIILCIVFSQKALAASNTNLWETTRDHYASRLYPGSTERYSGGVPYGQDVYAYTWNDCIKTCNARNMECCQEWCSVEACKQSANLNEITILKCLTQLDTWKVCKQNLIRERNDQDCRHLILNSRASMSITGPKCICNKGEAPVITGEHGYKQQSCEDCNKILGWLRNAYQTRNLPRLNYLVENSSSCSWFDNEVQRMMIKECKKTIIGSHAVKIDEGRYKCACPDGMSTAITGQFGFDQYSCESCDSLLRYIIAARNSGNIPAVDYLLSNSLQCNWHDQLKADDLCNRSILQSYAVKTNSGAYKCVCPKGMSTVLLGNHGNNQYSCENCSDLLHFYKKATRDGAHSTAHYILNNSWRCSWYESITKQIAEDSNTSEIISETDYLESISFDKFLQREELQSTPSPSSNVPCTPRENLPKICFSKDGRHNTCRKNNCNIPDRVEQVCLSKDGRNASCRKNGCNPVFTRADGSTYRIPCYWKERLVKGIPCYWQTRVPPNVKVCK